MPTSNGQVNTFDIRRGAVVETTIRDEAVTTGKIPDLAVTFPDKIDDPIWVHGEQGDFWSGGTLDTNRTEFGQFSVDIPSWVDNISVFVTGDIQFTNDTGGSRLVSIKAAIDSETYDTNQDTVANGDTVSVYHTQIVSLIGVAGSTITVGAVCFLDSSSSTNHNGNVRVLIVGTR